ncbi:MAG: methyltransferase family protein [Acidimicrobiia bacterium]
MPDNLSQNDSDSADKSFAGSGGWWVVAQGAIFVFFLVSVLGGEPVEDVPGIVVARIVGVVIAVAGALLSAWAGVLHGSRLSPFPKPADDMPLIETGPYRYVRHPMYSGIILFTLGVGLAYANPVTMLSSLAFAVFFMAKTGHEEDMLVDSVPGYRAYRSDVHWRLIPFVV